MRTARLVGLSQDGQSLIVVTDTGEEMAILADDRLRAALRGDRPRLGQLEIEMESALRPRDIQSRIRAGATLEEVAQQAGIPLDRVERFAAPVLAEREHIATLAQAASVRRRGETSGHKKLRAALAEKLSPRGVDLETIEWDSSRMDDGRWSVTARFQTGKSPRTAIFFFDVPGRFSVAGNDEARWVLGEQTPKAPGARKQPLTPAEVDTEPTVDLSDDLALVRAVREEPEPGAETNPVQLELVEDVAPEPPSPAEKHAPEELAAIEEEHALHPDDSQLDVLYDMLGGDGYAEDSVRVYAGLSDASAIPDAQEGWEPEIVVNYPDDSAQLVEPSLLDEEPEHLQPALDVEVAEPEAEVEPAPVAPKPTRKPAANKPAATKVAAAKPQPEPVVEPVVEVADPEPEVAEPAPAKKAPAKKKRASVPSWDEIMFGGPKPK